MTDDDGPAETRASSVGDAITPATIRAAYAAGTSAEEIGRTIGRTHGDLVSGEEVLAAVKGAGIEEVAAVLRGFMAARSAERTEEVTATSRGDGEVARARAVIANFEAAFKETGTLGSNGRFDRSVVNAYTNAVKRSSTTGPPILDIFRARAGTAGVDPREAESFVRAVQRHVQGRSVRLVPFDEIMAQPDPRFLIDGLIEEGSLAAMISEPKLGKTFVVHEMCFCVAAGLPWLGRPVVQGPVIYVGAEGGRGLSKRYRALFEHHGLDAPPADFHTINRAINLLDPWSVAEAITAVEECNVKPVLVVFDTYARSMVGGDENSAKDSGLVIDAIDRLRFDLNTAVLVIHHLTKRGDTERGSGVLRGACDTMLRLDKARDNSNDLLLTVTGQRNFDEAPPIRLRLEPVGESLVPVEVAHPESPWHRPGESTAAAERRAKLAKEILTALGEAHDAGLTPVNQRALLKDIIGFGAELKGSVLHELADDPLSPVVMERDGRSKFYRLNASNDSSSSAPLKGGSEWESGTDSEIIRNDPES
jgi:hypothetical protein